MADAQNSKQVESKQVESKPRSHDDIVAAVKSEGDYLEVLDVKSPWGSLVFRPLTDSEYHRLSDKLGDSRKSDFSAQREAVLGCRLYPDADQFMALLRRKPGLTTAIVNALFKMSGGDIDIEVGKS